MGGVPRREPAPPRAAARAPSSVAFEFLLLWAGRHQPDAWEALCAEYRRRIAPLAPVRERAIRVAAAGDDRSRRRAEGRALADAAPAEGFWVALDRRGQALDSEALARRVERWRAEWPHAVVLFLGSDLGLERARRALPPPALPGAAHAAARP